MITCLSIEMHLAWAEAGCGYVHMYVRMRSVGHKETLETLHLSYF